MFKSSFLSDAHHARAQVNKMAKILVVEDDLFIQNLMVFRLESQAHQVLVASNGQDGISLAQSENPDIILMDLRLPILDGWQATETLKKAPETERIPILALTAQSYTAMQARFPENTGCDGYIPKPIDFSSLFSQIDSLTDKHLSA